MREDLAAFKGQRRKFSARFKQMGSRTSWGYLVEMMLFVDITDVVTGKVVADHLWMGFGKRLQSLKLNPGDMIEFIARVGIYWKGYVRSPEEYRTMDYHLIYPTGIKRISPAPNNLTEFSK